MTEEVKILNESIDMAPLGQKAILILKGIGINTFREYVSRKPSEILEIEGFGRASFDKVELYLMDNGFFYDYRYLERTKKMVSKYKSLRQEAEQHRADARALRMENDKLCKALEIIASDGEGQYNWSMTKICKFAKEALKKEK